MEKQKAVYIDAEERMRTKAAVNLNYLFEMMGATNAPKEEREQLRDSFIACIESIEIKEVGDDS